MYDYLDLRQTERLKELVPYKALAPDADEIIEELDRLNNKVSELENINEKIGLALDSAENKVDRLNNIINKLEKWIKENDLGKYRTENVVDTDELLDKLKALKEDNKDV